MEYFFTEIAMSDIIKHSLDYEKKQSGLGEKFLDEVYFTAESILLSPNGFINLYKNTRECNTKTFPFKLIYTVEHKVIYIHAVYPTKADPKNKYKNLEM